MTHHLRPSSRFVLSAFAASVLTACGGGGDDSPAPPAVPQVSTALDASFAQQGRLALDLGDHGGGAPVVLAQPDGKLLLVLQRNGPPLPAYTPTTPGTSLASQARPNHLQVMRLLANGQPDASFGQQGTLSIGLLGSETVARALALPGGAVRLSIRTTEPCTNIDQLTNDIMTAVRTCVVDVGSAGARTAQRAMATALIGTDGQLDARSVDVSQLELLEAVDLIGRRPVATTANNTLVAAPHLWTGAGYAYPYGGIFSWGITRSLLASQAPDPSFGKNGQWQSACASDAGLFARDAAGSLWAASSKSTLSGSKLDICLERVSPDGQSLWAQPVHVPLNAGSATVRAMEVLGQTGHVTATSRDQDSWTAHTLQFNDQGSLRSSYGQQGIARIALPGALSQVRYEQDGSAWLHSQDAAGQNHLQHVNAQGALTQALGTNGDLRLDGAAANAELRLIDQAGRWLMLAGDASANRLSLIRVQGNAAP